MKKIYDAPKAEKVNFDYTVNVVASSTATQDATTVTHKCTIIVTPTNNATVKCL